MNRFIVATSTSAQPFFTDVVTWGETLRGVTGGRSVATQGMAGVGDHYSDFSVMTKHNDAGNEILKKKTQETKA